MKKFVWFLALLLIAGGAFTAYAVFRPIWDLRAGDKIKAVIIDENTGEILKESEEITLR